MDGKTPRDNVAHSPSLSSSLAGSLRSFLLFSVETPVGDAYNPDITDGHIWRIVVTIEPASLALCYHHQLILPSSGAT
jgi:hypothetical protein